MSAVNLPCDQCEIPYTGSVCPSCNAERPGYTALKNITRKLQDEQKQESADDTDVARIARHCGAI